MAQAQPPAGAIVINMGNVEKEKKTQESLFGPNIGVVNTGPAWTTMMMNEKKVLTDELTQDVVHHWIEKSKEPNQPTTTLQALVNLKRPSLRLSPLQQQTPDDDDDEHHHHHQHGLEFEYDCDAPKCGIYVHVLLPPDHPDVAQQSSSVPPHTLARLLVFETVVDGGFGRVLKLEDGATLELGRFEAIPLPHPNASTTSVAVVGDGGGTAPVTTDGATTPTANRRKRFTRFNLRRRRQSNSQSQPVAASGPALAVVDAQPSKASPDHPDDNDKDGVKVTIRLAALDEDGTELAVPNEQVTYLDIIRFGVRPTPPAPAEGEPRPSEATAVAEHPSEDPRPWVVKVVKREATIGPHTFHLHEIYGLSTSSLSSTLAPTAPLPQQPHTYPPQTPGNPPNTAVPLLENSSSSVPISAIPGEEAEPSSECLVCLSSPREVVLLPCRHLVACKDCALNMVEFGAGGVVNQGSEAPQEPSTTTPAAPAADAATEPAAGTEGEPTTTPPALTAPGTTPPAAPRRKRKAKGWFCPVCRQPYTSLLRITTTTPPTAGGNASTVPGGPTGSEQSKNEASTGSGGDPLTSGNGTPPAGVAGGTSTAETTTGENPARSGIAGLIPRPGFLRSLSLRGNTQQRDVESQ